MQASSKLNSSFVTTLWNHSPIGPSFSISINKSRPVEVQFHERSLRAIQRHLEENKNVGIKLHLLTSCSFIPSSEQIVVSIDRVEKNVKHVGAPNCLGEFYIPCKVSCGVLTEVGVEDLRKLVEKIEENCCNGLYNIQISRYLSLYISICFTHDFSNTQRLVDVSLVNPLDEFHLQPINPLPIIQTALSKNLTSIQNPGGARGEPKSGFLTMDQSKRLLLVLQSDPKATSLPLVGIWTSGMSDVDDTFVWASLFRFAFNKTLKNRVCKFPHPFLLILFSPFLPYPQFFECNMGRNSPSFGLFTIQRSLPLNQFPTGLPESPIKMKITKALQGSKKFENFQLTLNSQQSTQQASCINERPFISEDIVPRSIDPSQEKEMISPGRPLVPDVTILYDDVSSCQSKTSKQLLSSSKFPSPTVQTFQMDPLPVSQVVSPNLSISPGNIHCQYVNKDNSPSTELKIQSSSPILSTGDQTPSVILNKISSTRATTQTQRQSNSNILPLIHKANVNHRTHATHQEPQQRKPQPLFLGGSQISHPSAPLRHPHPPHTRMNFQQTPVSSKIPNHAFVTKHKQQPQQMQQHQAIAHSVANNQQQYRAPKPMFSNTLPQVVSDPYYNQMINTHLSPLTESYPSSINFNGVSISNHSSPRSDTNQHNIHISTTPRHIYDCPKYTNVSPHFPKPSDSVDSGLVTSDCLTDSSQQSVAPRSNASHNSENYQLLAQQNEELEALRKELALLRSKTSLDQANLNATCSGNQTVSNQSNSLKVTQEDKCPSNLNLTEKCSLGINTSFAWPYSEKLSSPINTFFPHRSSLPSDDTKGISVQEVSGRSSLGTMIPFNRGNQQSSNVPKQVMNYPGSSTVEDLTFAGDHINIAGPFEQATSFVSEIILDMPSLSPSRFEEFSESPENIQHEDSIGVNKKSSSSIGERGIVYKDIVENVQRMLARSSISGKEQESASAEMGFNKYCPYLDLHLTEVSDSNTDDDDDDECEEEDEEDEEEEEGDDDDGIDNITKKQLLDKGIDFDKLGVDEKSFLADLSLFIPTINQESILQLSQHSTDVSSMITSQFQASSSDLSMRVNSFAMKYLTDEQLAEFARLIISNSTRKECRKSRVVDKVLRREMKKYTNHEKFPPSDLSMYGLKQMSFATREYLEKYGLIDKENCSKDGVQNLKVLKKKKMKNRLEKEMNLPNQSGRDQNLQSPNNVPYVFNGTNESEKNKYCQKDFDAQTVQDLFKNSPHFNGEGLNAVDGGGDDEGAQSRVKNINLEFMHTSRTSFPPQFLDLETLKQLSKLV